jgi:lipopolysaccharide transport system permease protein
MSPAMAGRFSGIEFQTKKSLLMPTHSELPVRVYSPEPLLGHPAKLFGSITKDIWAGRELAWRLFVRDLSAQYRQSFLGYFWAILPPLTGSLTFIFLNSSGIVSIKGTGISYAAFAMMGTLLWQVFVDAMNCPIGALNSARAMLTKINFPREAILLGGIYMLAFNFLIRLLLVAGVMILWKIPVDGGLLFFPFASVSLFLAGFSIGLLLAPVAFLYSDIGQGLSIITRFWIPISPLITTARECLTAQPLTLLPAFWIVTACAVVATFLGLVLYRLAMPHLIVRMGG